MDQVGGGYTQLDGELYYRIANVHLMPSFFMSLVGPDDHWMFISSDGALTAGRRNADHALFRYAADDQISTARADTGSFTLIRMTQSVIWEPFAPYSGGTDSIRRHLYKTPLGNKLIFEEINETRQLCFRYRWTLSLRFGFVRQCHLENIGGAPCSLDLLDGLRNVLPPGVGSDFYMRYSNLANAYKKSELLPGSNLGLFYLSSIPTDRAEPSESLETTTLWQTGLSPQTILLSSSQVDAYRSGRDITTESDLRGQAGAFLIHQPIDLAPGESVKWQHIAELNQDHSEVIGLDDWLRNASDLSAEIARDIENTEQDFKRILSSVDAMQCGANQQRCNRHLSNTVFNVMRGGLPLKGYRIQTNDFRRYVAHFNRVSLAKHHSFFTSLPDQLDITQLRNKIELLHDSHLTRLALEYLPFAFSRRHGDPTRPWNHFSIELRSNDGQTNLDYQGNWRDIFQNWEALAHSFPDFTTAMICRFVNATTADGYNPYRLTRNGFEWETPAPNDPWANIGYWGDHQIIYLLKLLEWSQKVDPQCLDQLLQTRTCTHSNIPYRIKEYLEIKRDPRDTILYDRSLAQEIHERVATLGADGKLLTDQSGEIHYVTLAEKLLTLSLAKLSNFIPDGGIWLNTQRPEWNDANNALVGNGVSLVTTCYLYRWFHFLEEWFSSLQTASLPVSQEVAQFYERIDKILQKYQVVLTRPLDPESRLTIVDALSNAGSVYRSELYDKGFSGKFKSLSRRECIEFFKTAQRHLQATIRNNLRPDGLYHAYNLLRWSNTGLEIGHLYEMLEGQVAVLSSGILSAGEVVDVLDSLRQSTLYREDQDSYILYPDRKLPRFLEKNLIHRDFASSNPLVKRLLADSHAQIVHRDIEGGIHFNSHFRNSGDLQAALERLGDAYSDQVKEHGASLVEHFDDLFDHHQFTGRSGTFFAYEGLGSVYWHMVSKLNLAVSENYFSALEHGSDDKTLQRLASHYESIRHGIGAEKSPEDYGAFPSDPYSHTPENAGVKQPGMTGQVKEDLLARFAELGIQVRDNCLSFHLDLFDRKELLNRPDELVYYDLNGALVNLPIPAGSFAFTLFQVPFIFMPGKSDRIEVRLANETFKIIEGTQLDSLTSRSLFSRSGETVQIQCQFKALAR